jgi:hypothetical protein
MAMFDGMTHFAEGHEVKIMSMACPDMVLPSTVLIPSASRWSTDGMRNVSTILVQRDLKPSSDSTWAAKSAVLLIFAVAIAAVMMRD